MILKFLILKKNNVQQTIIDKKKITSRKFKIFSKKIYK